MTISNIIGQLSSGMLATCKIFTLTLIFSLPLGLLIAFGRMSKLRILQLITKIYISVMRGTPLMLQLLVVYFGPYYLFGIRLSTEYRFYATVIGFSINYAAYFAEIYRSGIETIPVGQREAAKVTETKDSDESDTSTGEDSTSEDSSSEVADTDSDSDSTTETVTTDKQEVLLLGGQDSSGNYYAKLESQSNIYTLSSSSVEGFLSIDVKTLVSNYVSNYIFADLDRVTIQKDGESYEFTKTTEEKAKEKDDSDDSKDEDSDSESDTETVTTYFMNGNEITLDDFSSFYSNISSLECQEWLDEVPETQDEPEMSVEFYKENGVYFKVEYYSYDSNFYLVKNNQGTACLVNKMKIKEIESSFEEFLEKQKK